MSDERDRPLKAQHSQEDWRALVDQARAQVQADLPGRELTPTEEVLRQLREERDEVMMVEERHETDRPQPALPMRLRQYAQDAQEFASTLAANGQKQAASHVRMATLALELAPDPAESRLLPIIAYASLVGYLKAQQEALDRSASAG